MRTTIDLPDSLVNEAKSAAAIHGVTLRDFVKQALQRQLQSPSRRAQSAPRHRLRSKNGFLVLQSKGKHAINPMPEQLDDWL